tara:strand:- start:27 stop:293 length:267 start_codon:yes stop_codon:yes gene_type:complete
MTGTKARRITGLSKTNIMLRDQVESSIKNLGTLELEKRTDLVQKQTYEMPDRINGKLSRAKLTHRLMLLMLRHELRIREKLAEMVDNA